MRRWHTRQAYRSRMLEIASRLPYLGLGADIITGFPGETDADHEASRRLVQELPYTYLHVFPFSARPVTAAGALPNQVPRRMRAARARDLRELGLSKGRSYRASRLGSTAHVVVETTATRSGEGSAHTHVGPETRQRGARTLDAAGTTEDYLRVEIPAADGEKRQPLQAGTVLSGLLTGYPDRLQLRV